MPKDKPEANGWLQKSAENGNADAQYKIGELHRLGLSPMWPKLAWETFFGPRAGRHDHLTGAQEKMKMVESIL